MKLRTNKKHKQSDDFEMNICQEGNHSKSGNAKNQSERDRQSSQENSNLSNENDHSNKHKLRNSSSNYQGKYKKMNSGKYLYKTNSAEKRPPIVKKKQLKFIPTELVSQFKKILMHLQKQDEESLLNKKKKREERQKPKLDKNRFTGNRAMPPAYQNIPMQQMIPIGQYDYYNQQAYLKNIMSKSLPFPQNQIMFFIDNGNRNYSALQQLYPFAQMIQQKEVPNPMNFDTLSKKKVVNHIYGALYIQKAQQANKNVILEQKKVPVSTVNLDEGEEDKNKEAKQNKVNQPSENEKPSEAPPKVNNTTINNKDITNGDNNPNLEKLANTETQEKNTVKVQNNVVKEQPKPAKEEDKEVPEQKVGINNNISAKFNSIKFDVREDDSNRNGDNRNNNENPRSEDIFEVKK